MILIDPTTRQRIVVDQYTGDVIYTKKGNNAVSEESKVETSRWKDYTGTGGQISKVKMSNPLPNQFQGTDQGIEGAKLPNLNVVGQNANIFRRREKRELRK